MHSFQSEARIQGGNFPRRVQLRGTVGLGLYTSCPGESASACSSVEFGLAFPLEEPPYRVRETVDQKPYELSWGAHIRFGFGLLDHFGFGGAVWCLLSVVPYHSTTPRNGNALTESSTSNFTDATNQVLIGLLHQKVDVGTSGETA